MWIWQSTLFLPHLPCTMNLARIQVFGKNTFLRCLTFTQKFSNRVTERDKKKAAWQFIHDLTGWNDKSVSAEVVKNSMPREPKAWLSLQSPNFIFWHEFFCKIWGIYFLQKESQYKEIHNSNCLMTILSILVFVIHIWPLMPIYKKH